MADHVFVCAGAIQTPALLQRSGIRRNIGANLSVHPTVKVVAEFDEEVNEPGDLPTYQVEGVRPMAELRRVGESAGPHRLGVVRELDGLPLGG
ncbi:MAG: GMC family oxidoreductase N-terminal domain-containing protein [Nocardioidaceae bacterium]